MHFRLREICIIDNRFDLSKVESTRWLRVQLSNGAKKKKICEIGEEPTEEKNIKKKYRSKSFTQIEYVQKFFFWYMFVCARRFILYVYIYIWFSRFLNHHHPLHIAAEFALANIYLYSVYIYINMCICEIDKQRRKQLKDFRSFYFLLPVLWSFPYNT